MNSNLNNSPKDRDPKVNVYQNDNFSEGSTTKKLTTKSAKTYGGKEFSKDLDQENINMKPSARQYLFNQAKNKIPIKGKGLEIFKKIDKKIEIFQKNEKGLKQLIGIFLDISQNEVNINSKYVGWGFTRKRIEEGYRRAVEEHLIKENQPSLELLHKLNEGLMDAGQDLEDVFSGPKAPLKQTASSKNSALLENKDEIEKAYKKRFSKRSNKIDSNINFENLKSKKTKEDKAVYTEESSLPPSSFKSNLNKKVSKDMTKKVTKDKKKEKKLKLNLKPSATLYLMNLKNKKKETIGENNKIFRKMDKENKVFQKNEKGLKKLIGAFIQISKEDVNANSQYVGWGFTKQQIEEGYLNAVKEHLIEENPPSLELLHKLNEGQMDPLQNLEKVFFDSGKPQTKGQFEKFRRFGSKVRW